MIRQAATQTLATVQGARMRTAQAIADLAATVCESAARRVRDPKREYARYQALIDRDHAELAFAENPDEPRITTPRIRVVKVGDGRYEWHMSLSVPLHPGYGEFAGIAGIQQVMCAGGVSPTRALAVRHGDFRAGVILAPIVLAIDAMNRDAGS